nr:hypothetical protein [uncultured Anaerocolumna sp.]
MDNSLNIPRLPRGKVLKTDIPYLHDSHSEPEMVSPLETMNQAFREVFNETFENENKTIPCAELTVEFVRKGDE